MLSAGVVGTEKENKVGHPLKSIPGEKEAVPYGR